MIKRLVIHRFRGIRKGVLEDIGKINLLIGPNNSGKTAILELLYLGGTSGRPCELILENVPNGAFVATTSVRFDFLGMVPLAHLHWRHGLRERWAESPATLTEEKGLAITLSDLPEGHPLRDLRLGAPLPEPGRKDRTAFSEEDLDTVALFSLNRQEGLPAEMMPDWLVEQKVIPETSRWHYLWQPKFVYKWKREASLDHIAVWAEEGEPPYAHSVLFFDFHTAGTPFTERFARWAYDNIPDWYEQIAESVGRVFPTLKGAKVEIMGDAPGGQKGKTGYIRFPGRTPLAVDQFGDGVRHTFKALASLIALIGTVDKEHPGLFLWEDPELFMHPATLGRMLHEVTALAASKPVQVFITTQSLEVLAWWAGFLDENSSRAKQSRTFYLQLKEGVLQPRVFRGKEIMGWMEFVGDPRMIDQDEMASPLVQLLRKWRTQG